MAEVITLLYGAALLPYAASFGIAAFLLLAPSLCKLSGPSFTEYFQETDAYMRVRAPLLSAAQVALTLPLLALTWDRRGDLPFWMALLALALTLVAALVAARGNAPLNWQMRRWSPAEPPPSWERVRDRWLRLHGVRGAAEAAGFTLLLGAALIDGPSRALGAWRRGAAEDDGPAPRRWEATVYLPLADNQGRPFGEAEWHDALGGLVTPFGGATLGQELEGCWRNGRGRLHREWVRPVVISFLPERLPEFRAAVHDVGKRLGQEAIYVRFEQPRVVLIHPDPAPTEGGR
jgi:hypothetical protein